MPFEVMDHRGISTSSDLFHDISFLAERQIGFWKPKIMPDHHDKLHDKAVHMKLLVNLSPNDVLFNECADTDVSDHEKDESIEYLKEIEVQTIGNLLPDEDDLFSGVIDELEIMTDPVSPGNLDDFDIFCSGGGMELDGSNLSFSVKRSSDNIEGISSGQGDLNGSFFCEHPNGELPSRTLFVRNINNNVEDCEIRLMFEHYGDIRTLYTTFKHRGFVTISYYDIRAALNAMRELQNKPLRNRKLDIHYSSLKDNYFEKEANEGTVDVYNIDYSISNDEICRIYGVHGEIKEIRENPHKHRHKFVEYYDVRAAEAALWALNRFNIAKKQIGTEPSLPESRNCINRVIQRSHELAQDESSDGQSPDNEPSSHCMAVPPRSEIINCSFIKNGYIQEHSAIHVQESIKNNFSQGYCSAPKTFPSGVKACASNQYGMDVSFYSPNQMNFAAGVAGTIARRIAEGVENRHSGELGPNGHHPRELSGDGFGSLGKKNSPLHGDPYRLNNSNLYQYHPSSPMGWQNLPSLMNSVHSHHQPQLHGYPEASSMHYSQLGSSLTVDASIWDRRMAYTHEAPRFHLGSPLNSLENASKLVFSSANSGLCSPQEMSHIFPKRYPVMSVPPSFESPHERMRSRRKDNNSNHAGKKQFELDIGCILRGEDRRTTLMLKNIPNKYTSKMLLASIDEHHHGTYDFIYLPIDFKNKCNVGYAFINMTDPLQIVPFHKNLNGKKWEKFNSEKVASLAYARIQGKSALVTHFQNSSLMSEDKRCRPILFHTDGPNAGDQEPFPMGTNIRSRHGKPQSVVSEAKNQGIPSTSANGEESSHETDSSSDSAKDY